MILNSNTVRPLADWLGVFASSACAVHCLLIPVLLVSGTALPMSLLGGESFHQAMVWIILPVALIAFGLGFLRHRDRRVLALAVVAAVGMILSVTLPHEVIGESAEKVLTLFSATFLIYAHFRNYKICRNT
ncbi:MAG: MerC domain-containing protein [Gammaproteobacteria bacterium]